MLDHSLSRPALQDRFGRHINYVRLSVTDRCDLRCTYCMAEDMVFLPKSEVLSLEELLQVSDAFIRRGVRKFRLTGGEPLVRRDIMWLIKALGMRKAGGSLDEVTLTTNGTQLERYASDLAAAGVERINVSLDTLDGAQFTAITRLGRIDQVLSGIRAAQEVGLQIKINMVAMRGVNDHEVADMLRWCKANGLDLTLIETMPMGEISEDRSDHFMPLDAVFNDLIEHFDLSPTTKRTGGPARYWRVDGGKTRLGLITPLTQNFCADCNRIRVTCTGRIYMCLGQDDHIDLRAALRGDLGDQTLDDMLDRAMIAKPEGHDFAVGDHGMTGQVGRHMSHTGG